jgi:hypothetical protein
MVKLSDYAGERFVSIADVSEGPITGAVTEFGMGSYGKPVVTLDNGYKVSLNKGACRALVAAYGDGNGEQLVGKMIEASAGEIMVSGKLQPTLVVTPISPKTATRTASPAPASAKPVTKNGDLDDAIPF